MMGSDPEIIVTSLAEISSLRDQLLEKEREMQEMTKSWQERLKKSEERKVQEAKSLEVSLMRSPASDKMLKNFQFLNLILDHG